MKHSTQVERLETRTIDVYTCDFCKQEIPRREFAKYTEVTLELRKGNNYGDSGESETQKVDCCEACWHKVALPALRNAGAKERIESANW